MPTRLSLFVKSFCLSFPFLLGFSLFFNLPEMTRWVFLLLYSSILILFAKFLRWIFSATALPDSKLHYDFVLSAIIFLYCCKFFLPYETFSLILKLWVTLLCVANLAASWAMRGRLHWINTWSLIVIFWIWFRPLRLSKAFIFVTRLIFRSVFFRKSNVRPPFSSWSRRFRSSYSRVKHKRASLFKKLSSSMA